MPLTSLDYVAGGSAILLGAVYLNKASHGSKLPLPLGPPRWPFIGCLLSIPQNEANWLTYIRWGKETGSSIIYLPVFGQDTIILNSHEAAVALLEKRSASYSDRPKLVMAAELMGWKQTLGLSPYGDSVKSMRKLLHDGMSPKVMQGWWPLQEQEATKFLQRLLRAPKDFEAHIRQTAAASVVKITYGYTVKGNSDEYIAVAERAMDTFSYATTPGTFLVDFFPSLGYVPWAPHKQKAVKWREYLTELAEMPMRFVHDQIKNGTSDASFVSRWLDQPNQNEDHESTVKWAAASLYAGGADTTVSSVSTFFVAMIYNPSVQAAAQEEIERVVGTDRLPTYADRASLPYVEAVYKEVLRWQPVAPIGVPHRYTSSVDDEYQGVRIPAGATIVANVWAMLRDPEVYKDPESFNPSRYLGLNEAPNPEDVAFGFGRRRCPGIAVAQSSVWLSIALTLAAYNIEPVMDKDGKAKLPSLDYSVGIVSHPKPFECTIEPRSEKMRRLIEDSEL
ncbi:cytochrome P450 [Ceratobasidium sp. AG-I]|nr:cytochrome P450 [Ceratobasidium sp. AG-I]